MHIKIIRVAVLCTLGALNITGQTLNQVRIELKTGGVITGTLLQKTENTAEVETENGVASLPRTLVKEESWDRIPERKITESEQEMIEEAAVKAMEKNTVPTKREITATSGGLIGPRKPAYDYQPYRNQLQSQKEAAEQEAKKPGKTGSSTQRSSGRSGENETNQESNQDNENADISTKTRTNAEGVEEVWVEGYTRKDGVPVGGYWKKKP